MMASSGPEGPGISRIGSANTSPSIAFTYCMTREIGDQIREHPGSRDQSQMARSRDRGARRLWDELQILERHLHGHDSVEARLAGDDERGPIDAADLGFEMKMLDQSDAPRHQRRREDVGERSD